MPRVVAVVNHSFGIFVATTILLWMLPQETRSFQLQMMASSVHSVATSSTSPALTAKKLLIVGGGIGGLSSAFDAKHNLRPHDEVTVVSDRDTFQFTPSNPWVATRMRTPEDITLPLTEILPRHGVQFVHGKATSLDPHKQTLKLADGTILDYDYLIIATGPRLGYEEIPGATKENVFSVCTTPHASHTAVGVDKLVEDPGPVIVGSAQGSSCFGPAYEFALLLQNELRKRGGSKLVEQCPMTFLTPEPYIGHLGLQGAGQSRKILEALLTKKNIVYHTNCKIDSVAADHVRITTVDDSNRKIASMKLPTKFTMLIPPFRGQPVWKKVPHLTDSVGMIQANEFQQTDNFPNIFAVGACVSIPPIETTVVPTGPPKTGYLIESQGTAAVKNIRTMIDHYEKLQQEDEAGTSSSTSSTTGSSSSLPELRNRPLLNGLCITDFGSSGAIFLTLPQYPPRHTDITIHGKVATFAKIAFEKYFLHKVETGDTDPYYETYMLHLIGVDRVTSRKVTSRKPPPSKFATVTQKDDNTGAATE